MNSKLRMGLGLAAIVIACGVIGTQVLKQPTPPLPEKKLFEVADGKAGKAGEVTVTEEAMGLAEIKVATTSAQRVAEEIKVTGTTLPTTTGLVRITASTPGKVIAIRVRLGQKVQAGETLAVIESPELARAQADLRIARGRLSLAQDRLERAKRLVRLGSLANPPLEESKAKAIEAEKEVHEAEHHLSEEQTKLAEAESALNGLGSELRQSKSDVEVAKKRLDRASTLLAEELISKQEFERIEAEYRRATTGVEVSQSELAQGNARVLGAKSRVEAAEGELKLAKKRLAVLATGLGREERTLRSNVLNERELSGLTAQIAEARLEVQAGQERVQLLGGSSSVASNGGVITLSAPIAGTIQTIDLSLGEVIDTEHGAMTILDPSSLVIQCFVLPEVASRIAPQDRFVSTLESNELSGAEGVVTSVGVSTEDRTRKVPILGRISSPKGTLRAGAAFTGIIRTKNLNSRLMVPIEAVQDHQGKPTVYVSTAVKGTFEVRHVVLGLQQDGKVEIVEGLKAGESIAIKGTFYLKSEALKDSLSDGCCAVGG